MRFANSVLSSSLVLSLSLSHLLTHFLSHIHKHTHISFRGTSRHEKIPGALLVLMSQWEGRAIPFDWTAGGSACRPGSCLVCRSKRLRRGEHTHTLYTYSMRLHHHRQGRSFTECEDCSLLLQQGWLERRDTASWTRFSVDSLQSAWKHKTTAAESDSWSQHETLARLTHRSRLGRDFGDLRTAAWHHPGIMDTVLGILPTWCRSCKVGIKCLLTHTAPPRFAVFLEVT